MVLLHPLTVLARRTAEVLLYVTAEEGLVGEIHLVDNFLYAEVGVAEPLGYRVDGICLYHLHRCLAARVAYDD